jgi:hypothetical protein
MAEELQDPMAQYQEPVAETVVKDDAGGLPSVKEESAIALENFQFTEEQVAKYFKNGKLQGRFDNIEGVLNTLKSVEDKYANAVREQKSSATKVDMNEVAQPLIEKFMADNMELTPELIAEAESKGIDIRDVKLAAIDIREQVAKSHAIVGGADEYNAMLEWGRTNLDDTKKAEFDKGLKSGMGEYAIKGLYAEYKASLSDSSTPTQRISGDTNNAPSTGGYTSQLEIMKDKAYLNTMQGRNDRAAQAAHQARLARTPDHVVFGR